MIIIGVTGNSGAGKTTVATTMKTNLNALCINADSVIREIMKPGNEYYDEVVRIFGDKVLFASNSKKAGQVNRTKLGKALFSDEEKRNELNKQTFKYLGKELKKQILEHKTDDYIILDVPLLYDGGFDKICNYVVAVVADEKTKVGRICDRDKIKQNEAIARLDTQMSEDILKQKADFVIENNADNRYINLVNQILRILRKIKENNKK